MKTFAEALKKSFDNEVSITENGAVGFKTSGKKLVDLNFATSSLRKAPEDAIVRKFSDAFYEDKVLAVKWLFFARDVRGGMGERRLFRICLNWLVSVNADAVRAIIPLVAEYGRFDDLLCLEGTVVWNDVIDYIDRQLTADYEACKTGKPFSLLAKWLPSVNTSSPKSVALAKSIASKLGLTDKAYRKLLSKLRAELNVLEVKASAGSWGAVDYNAVPSQANLKYRAAFLKHDEERRRAWLAALSREDSGAKINASAAFPCDIVHNYMDPSGWGERTKSKDAALEAMWKALPDFIAGNDAGKTLVVADGSGSMTTKVSGNMSALEVANSLAIYFAEKLTGPFKSKYVTFSMRPQFVDFSNASSLKEMLDIALRHNECANTNVEAVFDLILDTAVKSNLKQSELPANVLVVSDMEFDSCVYGNEGYVNRYVNHYGAADAALFTKIAQKYASYGYTLPRLVFWNVASRTGTVPLQQNAAGVALVSGYSPAVAKMVFSAKLSPYDALVDTLSDKRYDIVEKAVTNPLTR